MDVKVVKNTKFVPIKFEITVVTEKELCDLWLRMNMSGMSVDNENGCYLKYNATQAENEKVNGFPFWDALDKLITKLKLRSEDDYNG